VDGAVLGVDVVGVGDGAGVGAALVVVTGGGAGFGGWRSAGSADAGAYPAETVLVLDGIVIDTDPGEPLLLELAVALRTANARPNATAAAMTAIRIARCGVSVAVRALTGRPRASWCSASGSAGSC
jgi:hypothetical protein